MITTIELHECLYADRIKAIMQDELLYKMSMPEGSPSKEDWEPDFHSNRYLLATKGFADLGFIQLNPLSNVCCVIHSYLKSAYWGKAEIAHECHELLQDWMLENTGYLTLVSYVPEKTCSHVLDRLIAEGYTMCGRIDQSIYFRDCLDNMIVLQKSLNRSKDEN